MDGFAQDIVTADFVIHALLGLLPVCCFLATLMYLDSYKLVPIRLIVTTIALGCVAAVASYPLNVAGLDGFLDDAPRVHQG